MKNKTYNCTICGNPFKPYRTTQKVCSTHCAYKHAEKKREQKEQKDWNQRKKKMQEDIMTRSQWMANLQKVFNQFIRLRDSHLPCISCGITYGQMHAGHYRTVGHAPQLRFDEQNVHKQCAQCNNFKGGNVVEYRINLIKRIGLEAVERIESDNDPKHYEVFEIKEMIAEYRKKIKELKTKPNG